MTHIQTIGGQLIPLANPQPEHIQLPEIAYALARIPRFGGHTLLPWSVADHSLLVLALLDPEITTPAERLAALLHDAHEAYLGDITSPVAAALRGTRDASPLDGLKVLFNVAIAGRFGFDAALFHHPLVRAADQQALAIEHDQLMAKPSHPWPDLPPIPAHAPQLHPTTPAGGSALYMRTAAALLLERYDPTLADTLWDAA